ncbi:hypothetical protein [Variovorax sp. DXTD-1]|uniref:hypothetical protein n=1 Tax=Variovorax sp. DXTD-1 TaxID=2495592 RepID=UPI000F86A7DF|nr:hypothetical protein [Variovorax sp. DXTD-1]RST54118.1 hypothetical protein EJI00_03050 [Variovorax sp. DXTD-1]
MSYTPRPGSVPFRVISFLMRNEGEELTRKDIATKFDCDGASLDTVLGEAMRTGLLERYRTDEGMAWKLGTRRITLPQDIEPTCTNLPASPFRVSVDVDPTAIKVRKGVPLKTATEQRQEAFDKLFATFEVGDSAEFQADWFDELTLQVKRYSRGKGVKFSVMRLTESLAGMERRA